MASGDNLSDLLALARAEMPDVPPEVWERFDILAATNYGGSRIYVAAQKKRRHLEALAALDESEAAQKIASLLGLSLRQAQRYKRIR